jgi:branched-subunit amino acid transport protein
MLRYTVFATISPDVASSRLRSSNWSTGLRSQLLLLLRLDSIECDTPLLYPHVPSASFVCTRAVFVVPLLFLHVLHHLRWPHRLRRALTLCRVSPLGGLAPIIAPTLVTACATPLSTRPPSFIAITPLGYAFCVHLAHIVRFIGRSAFFALFPSLTSLHHQQSDCRGHLTCICCISALPSSSCLLRLPYNQAACSNP